MPRLDQHFLIDNDVRDAILIAAKLVAGERVVEIGPGKGVLTRGLAGRTDLLAVEKDERLAASLEREFRGLPDFRLLTADFLKVDPGELGEPPLKFVANLPYAVATPILQRILSWDCWTIAVLMFQKEVAERILALPGRRAYGVLTLSVAVKAAAELVTAVPAESFAPRPKVDSAVVKLARLKKPLVRPDREEAFFRVVRAAFRERRKTAVNSISGALCVGRDRVLTALEACGLKANVRAEEIPPEAFLKLAASLTAE